MRKIAATYIIPGDGPPLKHGILSLEDDGTVAGLTDTGGYLREQSNLEYYSGILVPGFTNAYSRLENTGLITGSPSGAIDSVACSSSDNTESTKKIPNNISIRNAGFRMQKDGVVAAADFVCSTVTIKIKRESPVEYHNFIPVAAYPSQATVNDFEAAERLQSKFNEAGLPAIITPYHVGSLSKNTLSNALNYQSSDNQAYMVIKCREWNEMNKVIEFINHGLPAIPDTIRLIFIYEDFNDEFDLRSLSKVRDMPNVYFVMCPDPGGNIKLQKKPEAFFMHNRGHICIGTGDRSSSQHVSVFQQMIHLQSCIPELTLPELVEWACLNGAKALNIYQYKGSFSKGKRPGVNLITGADLNQLKLTTHSKIKALQQPA